MGKRFIPGRWLEKIFPKGIEKSGLLSDNLEIKKRYLQALVRATSLSGREITAEVYKTVDFYEQKEAALKAAGVKAFKQETLNGQELLKARLKNFLVYSEIQRQRKEHKGRMYRWLPSNANEPDPEHQLLYGKIFREGEGDKDGNMPGERWGCQCGIEWLADEDMTPSEKAKAVKIDFRKNSYLPHLNAKQLEIIGGKDKDVIFKRTTGQRNKLVHKEVSRKMYEPLIGQALYQPILPPMQDLKNKNYWHFIGEADNHKKAFVLLDAEITKKAFEIVHVLRMKEKNFRQFLKKYLKRQ
ncbi:hypothetical protein [Candidatus Avelusimicrobium stercoris]|uniref:hypothetical protein n=1 Tax=Candidatus Avelusimicrobium stercoris TaxID=1947924 RepID=UPI003D0B8EE0